MDGVRYSNTKFFEDYLNFRGILIEPSKDLFNKLKNNRSKNYLFNYTVSDIKGKQKFIGNGATGGLSKTMTEKHKNSWEKNSKEYDVESIPIRDLIKKTNIKYIDLFSIDVEGGKLLILNTFDWDIPVYIIVIELSNEDKIKDEECRKFLRKKNFTFHIRTGINEFWINKSYFRKEKLFKPQKKENIKNLSDLGEFKFLEKHMVDKVLKLFQN